MERKIYLFIAFFVATVAPSLGQSNKAIYRAYINGNMAQWKHIMDSLRNNQNPSNKEKLNLINYQYGYIAWSIDKNKFNEAKLYMELSEKIMDQLLVQKYKLPLLFAYKAAFIGFEIGIAKYKAPIIGQESLIYARQSVGMDSLNYLGYIQLGNIAYYTPPIFGGSKKEAMQYYLKALQIMDSKNKNHNWNYLNLLATIIHAYSELGNYETAKTYCIKALTHEPNFQWVKDNLYPQVLKKLNNE